MGYNGAATPTGSVRTAETLGPYLRALREQAGLSLRDLEAGTGVSNAYLSQLERDRIQDPSPHVLWAISECYGADYPDLLRRAGYPMPRAGPGVRFAGAERLTPDEREEIQEIIAGKLRRRRRGGEHGSAEGRS